MPLFQSGDFLLHSGQHSAWKLECEAITLDEMKVIAKLLAERLPAFSRTVSVSEDSNNPATILRGCLAQYAEETNKTLIVVDDVFTTGSTMSSARRKLQESYVYSQYNIMGAVIFAREPIFDWIIPLFTLSPVIRKL